MRVGGGSNVGLVVANKSGSGGPLVPLDPIAEGRVSGTDVESVRLRSGVRRVAIGIGGVAVFMGTDAEIGTGTDAEEDGGGRVT